MLKTKINCNYGLYLQNLVEQQDIIYRLRNSALCENDQYHFFGIYHSDDVLVGEIYYCPMGLIFEFHDMQYHKKYYVKEVLKTFCHCIFTEEKENMIYFHGIQDKLIRKYCSDFGFLQYSQTQNDVEYMITKRIFYSKFPELKPRNLPVISCYEDSISEISTSSSLDSQVTQDDKPSNTKETPSSELEFKEAFSLSRFLKSFLLCK